MYDAEIWGVHKAPHNEKVQFDYCKMVLGVKRQTSIVMIYYELGRYPLCYERYSRMLKFWLKIITNDNCIIQSCYRELVVNCINYDNWATYIKNLLYNLGMNDFWDNQYVLNVIMFCFAK